jgi:outer membrane lipoprotein-sorting protein
MFNTILFRNRIGLRYSAISTTFLKALLLFFLLLGQSYADDVLTQIAGRLAKTPISQGDFHQQKHLKVLHKPLISTGTFTYDQSKGVIWKTLTPVASLLLVNESKLLTGQGEQALPAAFGQVFKAMLGGDLMTLSDGFSITGSDRKTSWQLELTPKDQMLKLIIATMLLSGDTELRKLEIHEANGNVTDIVFDNITHPAQLTDEQQADFDRLSP